MNKRLITVFLILCMLMSIFSASAFATEATIDVDIYADGSTSKTTEEDKALPYSNNSIDVTAKAQNEAPNASAVYEVELVWGDMAFAWGTHDTAGEENGQDYTLTWNPETHKYEDNGDEALTKEAGWYLISEETLTLPERGVDDAVESASSVVTTAKNDNVLIFNHSNAAVKAEITVNEDTTDGSSEYDADTKLTNVSGYASTDSTTSDTSIIYELPAAKLSDIYNNDTTAVVQVAPTKTDVDAEDLKDVKTIATITVTISQVINADDNTIALTQDATIYQNVNWSVKAPANTTEGGNDDQGGNDQQDPDNGENN